MHSRMAFPRFWVVIAALVMAAVACNLQRQTDQVQTTAPLPNVQRPTVQILEPNEGATVIAGQPLTVKAQATGASGVTLVELRVNNLVVDSQVPAEAINPTSLDVVLDYTPQQAGLVTLSVTAYSNTIAGQPALRTINVVSPLNPGGGGAASTAQFVTPSPTYDPRCRARINVGLNFRTGPGTEYDKILTFNSGQEPSIIGYSDRPDGRWWQISWNGQIGWIKESYTTQMGDCSAIRPAVVPASPTPIPSVTPQPTLPGATATPTLPDLTLSDLSGPLDIQLGANNTAQATYVIVVRNGGGQTANQFSVAVALPSGQIQDLGIISALGPGQQVQIPSGGLTVTFNSPGIKRLLVTVDTANTVAESNEANNQAYLDITVNAPAQSNAITQPDTASAAPQAGVLVTTSDAAPALQPQALAAQSIAAAPAARQSISAANAGTLSAVAEMQGHGGTVAGVDFSPQGDLLVSASWDGTVKVWDVASGAEWLTLIGHTDRVTDAVFSPDGARIASASWDGTVKLWDTMTGTEITSFDHGAEVNSTGFSPDGAQIASGGVNPSGGGLVRVWDIASGSQLGTIATAGPVDSVIINANGTVAVATHTGSCDSDSSEAGIWNVSTGGQVTGFGAAGSGPVLALADGPNRAVIAGGGQAQACSGSGVIWLWDTSTGTLQTTLDQGGASAVDGVAFSPAGDLIASASADSTVRVWDRGSGSQVSVLQGHQNGATTVAFSPLGTLIASGGTDAVIRLWGVS